MQKQGGNFLLQALLALTLIVAFIPFFVARLARLDLDSHMTSAATQIQTLQNAARIYMRENVDLINYETTILADDNIADILEPYGLPLGFVPRTVFGQDIKIYINKTDEFLSAQINIMGGNMSQIRRAELVRRIGHYATDNDGVISITIPLSENFTDIVRRLESWPDENAFLTPLDMGGFSLESVGEMIARNGEFETAQFNSLSLTGFEQGRKVRNNIEEIFATRAVFGGVRDGASLTIARGTLIVDTLSARTIAKFGDSGNLTTLDASVYDFAMSDGRTSFVGPNNWHVMGNLIASQISFTTERLELSSKLDATRGQDVFISEDMMNLTTKSGIETYVIRASNITLRDQTSSAINRGGTGPVVLDIRLAGTSLFPDVLLDEIDNDDFEILKNPLEESADTETCRSIISALGQIYNSKSLSQNIICQYVFWQRLEKRINEKMEMMN